MAFSEPQRRLASSVSAIDPGVAVRFARTGLVLSILLLSLAPLTVADDYSVLHNTMSEAGGQGVDGAWLQRTGVVVTSLSVLTLAAFAQPVWERGVRVWLRVYALALLGLVIFPESPWDGSIHNETVARAHTAAGVIAVIAFVLAAWQASRGRTDLRSRTFDWLVIVAMLVLPQLMLITSYQGLLQRLLVGLGYVWLFVEIGRITRSHPAAGRGA